MAAAMGMEVATEADPVPRVAGQAGANRSGSRRVVAGLHPKPDLDHAAEALAQAQALGEVVVEVLLFEPTARLVVDPGFQVFEKGDHPQAARHRLLHVLHHLADRVAAAARMHMAVNGRVDQRLHGGGSEERERYAAGRAAQGNSGVAARKEMEHTVDVGGVADIPQFHVDVDESLESIQFHRKGRSVRQVVNQGIDFAQVNGAGKNSLHER